MASSRSIESIRRPLEEEVLRLEKEVVDLKVDIMILRDALNKITTHGQGLKLTKKQLKEKLLKTLRLACTWPCKTLVGDCRSLQIYCIFCEDFKKIMGLYPREHFDKNGSNINNLKEKVSSKSIEKLDKNGTEK